MHNLNVLSLLFIVLKNFLLDTNFLFKPRAARAAADFYHCFKIDSY